MSTSFPTLARKFSADELAPRLYSYAKNPELEDMQDLAKYAIKDHEDTIKEADTFIKHGLDVQQKTAERTDSRRRSNQWKYHAYLSKVQHGMNTGSRETFLPDPSLSQISAATHLEPNYSSKTKGELENIKKSANAWQAFWEQERLIGRSENAETEKQNWAGIARRCELELKRKQFAENR